MPKIPSQKRRGPRFSAHFIKRLSSWLVLSTALTLAVRSATSLYWDSDANPAGNEIDGTNLGGSGNWDTTSGTWWDGVSADTTWNNTTLDTAVFTGPAGTVTLAEPIVAARLTFNTSGYTISNGGNPANTLQLAGAATVETSKMEDRATIGAGIGGSGGLTKSGNGTLALTSENNTYTGDTVINGGRVVVSNEGQLGASETTISVNGQAGFGFTGGTLQVEGGVAGTTIERDLSLSGRGPNTVSAAFISGGNNTINGDLTTSSASETRLVSLYGTTTLNGQVMLGSGQNSYFFGNGNWIINGQVTSTGTNNGLLYKTGNSVVTTLVLNNADNNFQQQVRIDVGTVRVANGGALGSNRSTASVRGNGGTLEIRAAAADVGTFGGVSLNLADGNFTVFVDRAVGDYLGEVNQTVNFGEFRFGNISRTLTANGRNGYSLAMGTDPTASVQGNGAGNIAITNNLDGALTLLGTVQVGDSGANRTFTITGSGNTTFSGRINSNGTGFNHVFTKGGSGELVLSQGSAFFDANGSSSYTGNTNASDGTLSLRTIRAINEAGGQLVLSSGAVNFLGDEGTGAGETWTKVINLNSSQSILLANQTGTAPTALTIASNFVSSSSSTKSLYLGGENALDNTISGVIVNNGAVVTSIQKSGNGTWVLSGDNGGAANGFTGSVTIGSGTLKVADTFVDASRNVINDASAIVFNVDALRRTQSAGGTLEYVGAAGADSVENLGSLSYSAGSSTVKLTPGLLGTASLNFTNINTTGGATVNFVGGDFTNNTFTIGTVNSSAGSNGLLTRSVYWNGADFAYRQDGVLRAPVYGTDAGLVTSGTTLAAGHNEITDSFTTAGSISVSTLKINGGHTLTLGSGHTVTISGGGLLATGGASTIAGGTALALGTQTLVARVNEFSDSLRIDTVITGSGGLTKSGSGMLILSAENTLTGTVSINEGTVQLSGVGRLSGSDNANLIVRQDGVLDLNGSATGAAVGAFNGAGRVTSSGAGETSLSVGNGYTGSTGGTFSGILEDGGGKLAVNVTTAIASGTTTFGFSGLNTYTGATTLEKSTAGNLVLQVNNLADIGFASGIGAGDGANNAASLVFNGGTLQYVGATALIYDIDGARSVSTDRLFTLAGDGTIDSSPSYGSEIGSSAGSANNASLIFRNDGPVAFSGAGARTLTLQGNSIGDNLMNLRLIDNGADALSVTKDGGGLWILGNAANNYTGVTTISGGALQAQDGAGLSLTSNLTINGGVFQSSGTLARTLGNGSGEVQITGGASGFSASTAPLTVSLDGGAPLVWGDANFAPSTLVLSSTTALWDIHLTNDIDLGNTTRTVRVDDNTSTGLDFATMSGNLSSATATTGLTKTGNGTLYLLGSNTYTGNTSLDDGMLIVTSVGGSTGASSLGTGGGLSIGGGAGTAGLVYIGAGETSDRAIEFSGTTGTKRIDASGTGALILTGPITNSATGSFTLELRGFNAEANEFTGDLADGAGTVSVTKTDGGNWVLSGNNTFTGNLTISSGNLGFTNGNALGATDTGFILLSNGGLFAVGGAQTITREVRLNNNATSVFTGENAISIGTAGTPVNVIATSGSGTAVNLVNTITDPAGLTINGTFSNIDTSTNTTVTLNFQGTGATTWNGVIGGNDTGGADRVTAINFSAANSASLTLAGDSPNTFDGSATVSQGTLILAKEGALGTGKFAFNGGVLQTTVVGGVTITNDVAFNSGAPVTVSGSESITFTGDTAQGGTRYLTNDLDAGQKLTFTGTLTNTATAASTLNFDGAGTTVISGSVGTGVDLQNLTYNGTGTLFLTGDNLMSGSLNVNRGTVVLSGTGTNGRVNAASVVSINGLGILQLDNTGGNATEGRVFGTDLVLNGGTLDFIGNAAGSTLSAGKLTVNGFGGTIKVSGTGSNTLTFDNLVATNTGAFLDLGSIPDLGGANRVYFTNAPTQINGIIAELGLAGANFVTYDDTVGLKAFTNYNTSNNLLTAGPTDTMRITANVTLPGTRAINAVALDGNGLNLNSGGFARDLTITSGALLSTGGNNTVSVPTVTFGTTALLQVDGGSALDITSVLIGTGGFNKVQDGVLTLSAQNYITNTQNVSGGTLVLNGGLNTIYENQLLSLGGPDVVVDLNGNSQYFARIQSSGSLPNSGATITSTGGPAVLLTNGSAGSLTFTGRIRGDLTFSRVGGNTLTLESDQDYTGATILAGGTLSLRDDARLSATSSIELNYGALTLDNNGNLRTNLADRVKDDAAITMRGGTLAFVGRLQADSFETFGALILDQGGNTVTVTTGNNGAFFSAEATFASLTRAAGTTLNFTTAAGTLGVSGNNPHIVFTNAPQVIGDGFLGAWAITNSDDYAAYNQTNGVGDGNAGGFAAYETTFGSGKVTNLGANATTTQLTTLSGNTVTGMLRIAGAVTSDIAFTNDTDVLNLEYGGLLRSNRNNTSTIGSSSVRGMLTAGGAALSGNTELIIYNAQNVLTIHSSIVDTQTATGVGTGTVSLVKSGNGTLVLSAPNTYTGGTTVNQGTLELQGDFGTIVIPSGGLTLNGATVTLINNQDQIDSSNVVTLNGSSTLNLVGYNTLDSLVINNVGGTTAPTVFAGDSLTLTNTNAITATSANPSTVAQIGGILDFADTTRIIDVGAIQIAGQTISNLTPTLNISANIYGYAAGLTKTGDGLLELSGQNEFFGGVNVTAGGLVIGANSSPSTVGGSVTSSPLGLGTLQMGTGTSLLVDNANRTVVNAVEFAADAIFNNTGTSTVTMTLNGPITLANGAMNFTVVTPNLTSVLGGVIAATATDITKDGLGTLVLANSENAFAGKITVNGGLLSIANDGALGVLPATFQADAITLNNGGAFGSTATTDLNSNRGITLNGGGTLSPNTNTILTITGPISGAGGLAMTGTGTAVLAGNNTFTGGITVSSGTLLLSGTNAINAPVYVLPGGTLALANNATPLNGQALIVNNGSVGLFWDGDGSGRQETYVFPTVTPPANFIGDFGIAVNRVGTTAANKTIQYAFSDLPVITDQTITVTNVNGYGLKLTGDLALGTAGGTPTFNVVTTTASNVVQGLTLNGQISGTSGFIKSGNGALVLGNENNDFVGDIDIQRGVVSVGNDGQLGAVANKVVLRATGGTATFRATDDITFNSRVIQLASTASTRSIEVVDGATLTLNTAFDLNGGAGAAANLTKSDNGTLELNVANTNWSGNLTIDAGVVRISNNDAAGSGTIAINGQYEAALQLVGVTLGNTINLETRTTADFGGIQSGGTVEAVSGVNNLNGILNLTFDTVVGADAGAILNINGPIVAGTTLRQMIFTGAGDININSVLPQFNTLNKTGSGTLTITTANDATTSSGGLRVQSGELVLSGAGTYTGAGQGITVASGGILSLNDTGTPVADRLGGKSIIINGGIFNYTVSTTGNSSETDGGLTFGVGGANFNVINTGSRTGTLKFASLTLGSGSAVNFTGNLGAEDKILFLAAPTLVPAGAGILARALVNGNDFATYDATNGLTAFSAYNDTNDLEGAGPSDVMSISASASISASRTLAAIKFNGSDIVVGGDTGTTLTLTTGGILVTGVNNTLAVPVLALGTEGSFHVLEGASLEIDSALTGSAGFNKSNEGLLTLNAKSFATGTTYITGGTLMLNGGTNTLNAGSALSVGLESTLDLNGNSQFTGTLLTTGVGTSHNGGTSAASLGGVITSTNAATLVTNMGSSTTFAGQITGQVTFGRAGGSTLTMSNLSTYTGKTIINGGTTNLADDGRLANTSAIEINNATLQLNNRAFFDRGDRLNDAAAITLNTGTLSFLGRAQTDSTETVGTVMLGGGLSVINSGVGGTGINSAKLTLSNFVQSNPDATVNFTGTNLGLIGSTSQIKISTYTSNIDYLGGWAIVNGTDFASYDRDYGVGALNATGFPGYDGTTLTAANQAADNIRLTAGDYTVGNNVTINSLNLNGDVDVRFTGLQTVTLVGGGLLKSGDTGNVFGTQNDGSKLTAGAGSATALYVHNQLGNLIINSRIVDNGTSGTVHLVLGGGGSIQLNGSNSYSGGTVVNGGKVSVARFLPNGGVTINNGELSVEQGDGISDGIGMNNVVTLNTGVLILHGNSTLAGLNLNSNGATATTVNAGILLTLTGDINATPTSVATAAIATITSDTGGGLDFNGEARIINVAPITVGGVSVAPLQAGLNIITAIYNGSIVKKGEGALQLTSNESTFAGGVDLQSGSLIIGASSVPTDGSTALMSGPLGTGTLNVGVGTTLISTGNFAIANAVVINGDFTFSGASNLQLNGPIVLNQTVGDTTMINITVENPVMTATLGGEITGTVNNITKLGLGTLVVNPNFSGTITSSGGGLSLFADGDGASTPEAIQFGDLALNAPTTLNIGRLGTEHLPNYTLAANKTIRVANVETNGNTLTVNNRGVVAGAGGGGYGLEISGATNLSMDGQTYIVTTATQSDVVQGLTLSGVVSGNAGIIKKGNGTLVLGNDANSFGGTGKLIDIQTGVVSVASDGALGDDANVVRFNSTRFTGVGKTTNASATITVSSTAGLAVGASVFGAGVPANAVITSIASATTFVISAPATATAASADLTYANPTTFRATDDIETTRGFQFVLEAGSGVTGANAMFEVVGGKTLTLNSAFDLSLNAAGNVAKGDNGTLVLAAANASWDGYLTISAGAVRVGLASALGTTVGDTIVRASGGALQLVNGVAVADRLTLVGTGINNGGALQSMGAVTNTVTGAISLGGDATIGADSGNTLNLTGGISGAQDLTLASQGDINITTTGLGAVSTVTKIGAGTTSLEVASPSFVGTLTINDGTFAIRGAGRTGGSGTISLNSVGTLLIDNLGANVVDRFGGGTRRNVTSVGGTIVFVGNDTAVSSETFGTLTLGSRGKTTIDITAGASGQANLKFASLTRNERTTLLIESNSLSFSAGVGKATVSLGSNSGTAGTGATGARNKTIIPWAVVHDTTTDTYSFASLDGTFIRALGDAASGEVVNTLTSGANVRLAGSLATTGSISFNSLTLEDGSALTIRGGTTLTLGTSNSVGGILALPGDSTIGGDADGTGILNTAGNAELSIHTIGNLTIDSTIGASTGGVAKDGAGTLTLNQAVIRTGNFAINEGTVKLNGGTNTLWFNQNVLITNGATLDLNGNSQYVGILQSEGADAANGGGIIRNSDMANQANLIINNDNTARTFSGSITEGLNFLRGGQNTLSFFSNNTYTGKTQLSGGTTVLRDEGQFSATSAIDINYAALTLDNSVALDVTNRINNAAPITLRGANLTFQGSAQTNSTETLGAVTLAEAYSTILATAGGTGVNSAVLTLTSLTQGSADAVVNFNGSGGNGQLGQIGSNPRIMIANQPVLENNIIGGWAVINGQEFASYNSEFGVGSLGQTGFAGYDFSPTFSDLPSTLFATDNVRATTNVVVPSGGLTINSINIRGSYNLDFKNDTALLNLVSGGLIGSRTNNRVGGSPDSGRLTAGGLQSTGTASLYIYNTSNTYTINSRIVDNPNGAVVRLVLSASGGAITLTDALNTYTGGTVVNGGTVNLMSGFFAEDGPVIPAGGLTINGGTVTMRGEFGGQIDASNVVTLNGSSVLNLIGDNTLSGLIFNETGSGTSAVTPTVNTDTEGMGTLTLEGNITSAPRTVTTTSTVFGKLDFGNTQRTITVEPILFYGVDFAPLQAGFALQGVVESAGGFVKMGAGVLQFNGQTTYTGATVVNEGTIQIGSTNAGSRFSDYILNGSTVLNLNSQNTILGSLSGSGTVTNSGSARTLTVGFNDANTTFSGQLNRYSEAVLNAVSLDKVGSGVLTLTGLPGANVSSGTLSVSEGGVTYSGGGKAALLSHLVRSGGTLTLDNSGTNTDNRLAGTSLNISGGTFRVVGNTLEATNETVDTLTISSGTGELLLEGAGQNLTLTASALSSVQVGGTLVLRTLGGSNLQVTALNQPGGQGAGNNDETNKAIRPDIFGDSSGHALAGLDATTAFVTQDSDTQNLRPLTASEMETTLTNSSQTNFSLNGDATFDVSQAANSLRFENGVTLSSVTAGTLNPSVFGPDGLITQSVTTGGILALSGASFLNMGALTATGNARYNFYTLGSASVTVNAYLGISSGGLIKSGDGTLTLNNSAFYTGTTTVNAGELVLGGGDNTIRVIAGTTAATLSALQANGGVLNLNGQSQAFGTLSSNNQIVNTGGTITNNAPGSPINLVTSNTGTAIFAGKIDGNLNFIKSGNSSLTLTSASTYTGETIVRGNTLILSDQGSLLNTSAVSLLFGNLTLDNLGPTEIDAMNPQRLPDNIPLNIRGGTLALNGAGSTHSDFVLDEVNIGVGSSTIDVAPSRNSGATSTLTINSLTREFGGTVNFTDTVSTGSLSRTIYNGGQIFIGQINGVTLQNSDFLGSGVIVNSGDFGIYIDGQGVTYYGQTGIPAYGSAFVSGGIRNLSASVTVGTAGTPGTTVVGALRISGAATRTVSFANANDILNIESGGLLSSNENNARVIGSTALRGILTAGGLANSGVIELVVGQNQNAMTIHSVIADNNSGAAVALIKTLDGALTLTASNTYTGGTFVDDGTLTLAASTNGFVVVPGDLSINNATVTMSTRAQQIAATSNVTFSGGGALNLLVTTR